MIQTVYPIYSQYTTNDYFPMDHITNGWVTAEVSKVTVKLYKYPDNSKAIKFLCKIVYSKFLRSLTLEETTIS